MMNNLAQMVASYLIEQADTRQAHTALGRGRGPSLSPVL